MKKVIALSVSLVMVFSILAGCGDSKGTENNGMTTVKVWTNAAHTKDIVTKRVNEFNSSEGKAEGIFIDYVVQGGDYSKMLDVAIQTGDMPDLFAPMSSSVEDYVTKSAVTSIEDMPGGEEFLADYAGKLTQFKNVFNGKTYSVPYNYTTIGLVYNKRIFKENGIVDENGEAKAPATWDEVAEYAKKCTNTAKKEYGIALPLKWTAYSDWELVRPFFSSLGTVGYDFENDKFDYTALKPALEWLMKIKNDQSFYIGAEGLDNDPARAQFAEGRVAMKLAASWDVGVFSDQFPTKDEWGVAPIPSLTGTNQYKQWATADSLLLISSSVSDERKEKVMKVYEWFNSKDMLEELYKDGKCVPVDADVIAAAGEVENPQSGWKEFCEMSSISTVIPVIPRIQLEGDSFSAVLMKIWMGQVSIDEGLKDITERSNRALQKKVDNGEIDFSLYKYGDIDITR